MAPHTNNEGTFQFILENVPGTAAYPPESPVAALSTPATPQVHSRTQHSRGTSSFSSDLPSTPIGAPNKRRSPMTNRQKLNAAMSYIIDTLDLSFTEFLWEYFRYTDEKGKPIPRMASHVASLDRLLRGRGTLHTFAHILGEVLKDPLSHAKRGSEDEDLMYSISTSYLDIRLAMPAITTLAVELVRSRAIKEISHVVKGHVGLHGSLLSPHSGGRKQISWADISAKTPAIVQGVFKTETPLLTYLISILVTPPRRKNSSGVIVVRKMRPTHITSAEILSTIAHCRTAHARLMPVCRGILYFACGAQHTLFQYSSRVGHTPSYNTVLATLKRMAACDAAYLRELGNDDNEGIILRTDNVQQYLKRRELRIGRESTMKIGMSAMVNTLEGYTASALDLDDKIYRIRNSKRDEMEVETLLGFIDEAHAQNVAILQWVQVLVNYIPELSDLKPIVAKAFQTVGQGAKMPLPRKHQTVIHPLATVAKNENITTEFRDALVDFLSQIGQLDAAFKHRLIFLGGDGLTFERSLNIKAYLRDQSNELRRMDIFEPFIENWHAGWTKLSQDYATHWGRDASQDPSTLSHSTNKIGQKKPTNINKVDYYPAAYTVFLVLDVRMLDCWRILFETNDLFSYFRNLKMSNNLPSFEDLKAKAEVLHLRYSSHLAYEKAKQGVVPETGTFAVPPGSPWKLPSVEESSLIDRHTRTSKGKGKKSESEQKTRASKAAFKGDASLARSIMFIRDTMLTREHAQAISDGDPGRVYEAFKRMCITFAGSSHSKYMYYTLEQICNLEYESSPELKELFLRNWIINPSGEPGRYVAGDLHLEHLNLELEEHIKHKDSAWDDDHIRKVISPNIAHFVNLKNTFREGLGLSKRRGKHPTPHSRPEVKILLQTYKNEELHKFRVGRCYDDFADEVDVYGNGVKNLFEGRLQKFLLDWKARRGDVSRSASGGGIVALNEYIQNLWREIDEEEEEENEDFEVRTNGSMGMVDGELVVEYGDDGIGERLNEGENELDELDESFEDEI
ncbi:hypothetical protein QCA50_008206 [Cerrena zonata]|uniref:DUF6589 domain-containing protein n=1 Tax=Cerrena zonata TaxID=2478898 RepID=A0AAW0GEX5_9APHY